MDYLSLKLVFSVGFFYDGKIVGYLKSLMHFGNRFQIEFFSIDRSGNCIKKVSRIIHSPLKSIYHGASSSGGGADFLNGDAAPGSSSSQ